MDYPLSKKNNLYSSFTFPFPFWETVNRHTKHILSHSLRPNSYVRGKRKYNITTDTHQTDIKYKNTDRKSVV